MTDRQPNRTIDTSPRLFHVGLCVADRERSVDFYSTVAGMEVVERHERTSEQFDKLIGNIGTTTRVAYLRRGTFLLQLIEYGRAGGAPVDIAHNRPGSPHICFLVQDVAAEYERLQKLPDIKIAGPLVVLNPAMTSFYTTDPDGVPVELLELTDDLPEELGVPRVVYAS
jgi:catechol 2,3-dioxygenase-like lactoylglutathione lyase family enzyme